MLDDQLAADIRDPVDTVEVGIELAWEADLLAAVTIEDCILGEVLDSL